MVLYRENKNPCDRPPLFFVASSFCFLLYLRLLVAQILAVADKSLQFSLFTTCWYLFRTSFLSYNFSVCWFVKFATFAIFAILVSEHFGVVDKILANFAIFGIFTACWGPSFLFVTKLRRTPGLFMISSDRVIRRPRRSVKCEAKRNSRLSELTAMSSQEMQKFT